MENDFRKNDIDENNVPAETNPGMIRATDLIHEIGGAIVNDENSLNTDWELLGIVFTATENADVTSLSGFYYDADGNATPEYPSEAANLPELMLELRDAMYEASGKLWKAALFQITRETKKLTTHFDYNDENRWKVTPQNLESMREEIRPKLENHA